MSDFNISSNQPMNSNLIDDEEQSVSQTKKSSTSSTQREVPMTASSAKQANIAKPTLERPSMDATVLGPLLLALQTKLTNQELKTCENTVKNVMADQKAAHLKAMADIQKAAKAMKKAKAEKKKKKIFGWISTGVMAVAAAALAVVGTALIVGGIFDGGSTVLLGAMLVAGAVATAVAVGVKVANQTLPDKVKDKIASFSRDIATTCLKAIFKVPPKIADKIYDYSMEVLQGNVAGLVQDGLKDTGLLKKLGIPEKYAPYIAIGVQLAAVVAVGVAGLALAAVTGGSDTDVVILSGLKTLSTLITLGSTLAEGATQVAGGVEDVEVSFDQKDADDANTDKKSIEAFLSKMQSKFEDQQDNIKKIISELDASTSAVIDMMNSEQTSKQQINHNIV